jgi:hypothetical protein
MVGSPPAWSSRNAMVRKAVPSRSPTCKKTKSTKWRHVSLTCKRTEWLEDEDTWYPTCKMTEWFTRWRRAVSNLQEDIQNGKHDGMETRGLQPARRQNGQQDSRVFSNLKKTYWLVRRRHVVSGLQSARTKTLQLARWRRIVFNLQEDVMVDKMKKRGLQPARGQYG